jgi:hypothetical protein
LVSHASPLLTGRLGVVLGKRGGDEGGHDAPPAAASVGEHGPHEVHHPNAIDTLRFAIVLSFAWPAIAKPRRQQTT